MSTVRLRRLVSDFEQLNQYVRRNSRVRIVEAEGNPTEKYQLEYHVRGLRQKDDTIVVVKSHLVEVVLPRNYPRLPPQCRMLTPVFHPNIAPHAICIGDHWSASETLTTIVARIGEMLAYQSYNVKSPLNGEAARWVDENLDRLPLDPVSMVLDTDERPPASSRRASAGPAPARRPVGQPGVQTQVPVRTPLTLTGPRQPTPSSIQQAADVLIIRCVKCQAKLRLRREAIGQRIRCAKCETVFNVRAPS